jgi:hypothetical protein
MAEMVDEESYDEDWCRLGAFSLSLLLEKG